MFRAGVILVAWQAAVLPASLVISCEPLAIKFLCLQGSSFELTAVVDCVGGAGAGSRVVLALIGGLSLRWLERLLSSL